jgi:hypothetical protein
MQDMYTKHLDGAEGTMGRWWREVSKICVNGQAIREGWDASYRFVL